MNNEWFKRLIQVTAMALTMAAICQEMEKPKEKRVWHGVIAGFVPYDFRMPTIGKFKEAYWNPYENRLFSPRVFGIGWAINFYALLERLRFIGQAVSEEDFLMPGKHMREVLTHGIETE